MIDIIGNLYEILFYTVQNVVTNGTKKHIKDNFNGECERTKKITLEDRSSNLSWFLKHFLPGKNCF